MLIEHGATIDVQIQKPYTEKILLLKEWAKRLNKPEHLKLIEDAIAEQEYIYSCA